MKKKAFIAVSFGTTVAGADESICAVEEQMRRVAPDRDFYRAFASGFIRKKLLKMGVKISSPEEVLETLLCDGYDDILIQPTFVIPGHEYDLLASSVKNFAGRGASLQLGKPLISTSEDLVDIAKVLASVYSDAFESEDSALLLMGHGTEHLANFIFPSLQTAFRTIGTENAYVATVEGWPTIGEAIAQMKNNGVKRVLLAPFLLVAGDHATNDMAGDEDDSWKNVLLREGFEVECRVLGLGAYEGIRKLYGKRVEMADENTI